MLSELRHRDPLLFWTGAAMMLAFVVAALISIGDTRTVMGINPWIKPMKFLISVTIFMWTIAWFMPETRPNPAKRKFVSWTIALMMTGEIIAIITQAARGTTSHFNVRTGFDAAIFSAMGTMIMLNTFAVMVLLWIIRRDTPERRAGYIWGIRLGLIIFLLASAQGGMIITNNAHTVGAADGGAGLPFVNWSTTHGDLRIAHFAGLHALQALPLLGFLLDRNRVPARNVIFAVGVLWIAVT
ncbi:MAG TPA: hypothetical protein VFZ31_00620, partial [Vicinamibacterales bacterium]